MGASELSDPNKETSEEIFILQKKINFVDCLYKICLKNINSSTEG